MEPDYYIRQGDGGVSIADTLEDASGAAVSLQGATVKLIVTPVAGGAAVVSTTAVNGQTGDGSDGSKGRVSYVWGTSQTSTAGFYLGSWEVTFGGGAVQTYPNAGYLLIDISPDAPVTPSDLYVQVEELKSTLEVRSQFADADIKSALQAASRAVDDITGRRFYPDADANQVRYYTPELPWLLLCDDIATITTLQTDATGAGSYGTTWQTTDFIAEPLNAVALGESYTSLRSSPLSMLQFPVGVRKSVKLTGKFGWLVTPPQVKQATTMMAHRLLRRAREVPFGVSGIGLDGSVVRIMSSDPDVLGLLQPYIRRESVA